MLATFAACAWLTAMQGRATAADSIDFSRDVLPILSNKCFVCHGPDTHDSEMLRLDSAESATAAREGGRAIDPEHPQKSLAWARIHSADDPMPPVDAEKQLTDDERKMLAAWIKGGGQYGIHWSFIPPQKHENGLARDVIDRRVTAKLQEKFGEQRRLAEPAARETLARRVALVLTGLPPEPEQLTAFLADSRPDAYQRYVDRMLDNPRFGEHQARYWLDAVRYGDTHGLHLDNRRGIYPYRDWVVRAFNQNLPLDTFITWQLAGDLLPQPNLQQLVATGFVRMNPSTAEGGAIPAEFQAKNNFDRVETLGTVLLGMTLTCARCHSHKYDPISQAEYYRLLAFFNSTAESSMDGNKYEYGPVVKSPADYHAWDNWEQLQQQRAALLNDPSFEKIAKAESTADYASKAADYKASDWKLLANQKPTSDPPPIKAWTEASLIKAGQIKLPAMGKTKEPLSGWISVELACRVPQTLNVEFTAGDDSRVYLQAVDGSETQRVKASAGKTAERRHASFALETGKHRLLLELKGHPDKEQDVSVEFSTPWKEWSKDKPWKTLPNILTLIGDPPGPFSSVPLSEQASKLAQELDAARQTFTTTLVARDLPSPRATRLLRRGEYDQPQGEPLEPGVLAVMGAYPKDAPANRLGLARWLTSRQHPLVARVLVNQLWQRVFGAGLVRSPEDFGLQGQQPTHPALLDWLAVEMHDRDWDQKHLLREFLLSKTFQQRSTIRDNINDPENLWLGRGPSYRLDAEVLRDIGLWASGLLDPHMGGEGIKPYQPTGMWKALAHPASNTKQYVRDEGRRLYRRSLYVYWKRTSPHPMMTLFDAPDRESSCVRRSRTNTALQSLGLLNETQRVEMARGLAERLLKEYSTDKDRIEGMFRILACRDATERELTACEKLLASMQERYADQPDDAEALLKVGEADRDSSLDATEHAAWTLVASTLLASDLALTLY